MSGEFRGRIAASHRQISYPVPRAFRPAGWFNPRFVRSGQANGFFSGHNNELTADYSWITMQQPGGPDLKDQRIRAQWDISF